MGQTTRFFRCCRGSMSRRLDEQWPCVGVGLDLRDPISCGVRSTMAGDGRVWNRVKEGSGRHDLFFSPRYSREQRRKRVAVIVLVDKAKSSCASRASHARLSTAVAHASDYCREGARAFCVFGHACQSRPCHNIEHVFYTFFGAIVGPVSRSWTTTVPCWSPAR